MIRLRCRMLTVALTFVAAACVLIGVRRLVQAGRVPRALRSSFAFPASFATGVSGDLVVAPGSSTHLTFDRGLVAIGYLPVPRPGRMSRRGAREFVRPADAIPRARLLLSGVVDADGNPVTNTGNELMIDGVVSPGSAGVSPPPFVIPFDINGSVAFVDAPLPLDGAAGVAVRIQILGAAVIDPEGQVFGVLGFAMAPMPTAPVLRSTPTPGETPAVEGQCFVGPNCAGPSFAASRDQCCRFSHPSRVSPSIPPVSWCPANQYDPSTGQCAAVACDTCTPAASAACEDRSVCAGRCTIQCPDGRTQPGVCAGDAACRCRADCGVLPTPTATPGPCVDAAGCGGACTVTCADGTAVVGQCVEGQDQRCSCSAECNAPTPCSVGQCFDTMNFQCTGQPCGPGLRCPLPNQFCDVSGRRCPCAPHPALPFGRICCQCKDPTPACFTLSFADVQPICPPGCETFVQQECDPQTETCVAPTPCSTDQECDDGNGCTVDRCIAGTCTHDCICVGPLGCGPGPARR